MNQEIQALLRAYISFNQDDWAQWCPAAQMALNARTSAATGISPFFATHGYHPDPVLPVVEEGERQPSLSSAENDGPVAESTGKAMTGQKKKNARHHRRHWKRQGRKT